VITTDGSFGDIARENYIEPEERTIHQLQDLGKPFIVLLNTNKPFAKETIALAESIAEQNHVTVLPINCEQIKKDEIYHILETVLYEFPLASIGFSMPKWVELLDTGHYLKKDIIHSVKEAIGNMKKVKDSSFLESLTSQYIKNAFIKNKDLSTGTIDVDLEIDEQQYYQVITDLTGTEIQNEYQLIRALKDYASLKDEYEKVKDAMMEVRYKGYGVVTPCRDEIVLGEPEVIKTGNKFGVKIKAQAPSIHMIRTQVLTEIAPIVGSEQQAKDLMEYINDSAKNNENGIFETNIFGKSIEQIVEDGIHNKLEKLSEETQEKMKDTLEKITNDSNGSVICIIL
jgi:stage IV sporulation protein A